MNLSCSKDMEGLPVIMHSYQRVLSPAVSRLSPTMMKWGSTSRYSTIAQQRQTSPPIKWKRRPESTCIQPITRDLSSVSKPIPEEGKKCGLLRQVSQIIKRRSDKLTRTTESWSVHLDTEVRKDDSRCGLRPAIHIDVNSLPTDTVEHESVRKENSTRTSGKHACVRTEFFYAISSSQRRMRSTTSSPMIDSPLRERDIALKTERIIHTFSKRLSRLGYSTFSTEN